MAGWRDLIEISSAVGTGNVLPWIPEARRSHSVSEVVALGAVASLFALAAFLSTGRRRAGPLRDLLLIRHRLLRAPLYQVLWFRPPSFSGW